MLKLKVTMLLLLAAGTAAAQETAVPVAATTVVQETAAPVAATTAVQEAPTPISADDIKLKPAIDVVDHPAEPQKVDPPAATPSRPVASEKPTAKRAAARPHSTATREKARLVYPGYAAPM
jgi:hypothetical protein